MLCQPHAWLLPGDATDGHRGHPRLRPGLELSRCWRLGGFAVGTTATLVRRLCPSLSEDKGLNPEAVGGGILSPNHRPLPWRGHLQSLSEGQISGGGGRGLLGGVLKR